MKKRKIAVGPGASSLILIAVVLALTVLAVLTMISARNDDALSIRSVASAEKLYELSARSEKSLAKLDAVLVQCAKEHSTEEEYLKAVAEKLPEGMKLAEDRVSWQETLDNRMMDCQVRLLPPGEKTRTVWTRHRVTAKGLWEDEGEEDFDE